MKAFIVLSSGFKNENQDHLIKTLQDHVTYNSASWMSPEKVVYIILSYKFNQRNRQYEFEMKILKYAQNET